ncbi:hypothetical protein TNCV_2195491 [Trichonephila clavipes]|uniref:Uncharacterized protein n=1 Tax=Trichonephila clavipes TaxID=2585209 RepID=A0A8X6SPP3_TRICX|nr:hypothetical protein TNCV_2195491 [Trichonephila clavipes]
MITFHSVVQQDGATSRLANRLTSRFGPDGASRSFKGTGHARRSSVYADKPQTLDHLEDNIRRVIADIRPQMLEKVIENWDVQIGLHPSQPWQSYARNHLKCNATRLSFE